MKNKIMDIDKGVNSRSTAKLRFKQDFFLHQHIIRTSKELKTCFNLTSKTGFGEQI